MCFCVTLHLQLARIRALHRQNHGDHDRSLCCLLEEEAGDGVGDMVFDIVEVHLLCSAYHILDGLFGEEARVPKEVLRFTEIDKSARDDIGGFDDLSRREVERGDDDKNAVL